MSEVLVVAHGDSGVSEYEVASGQLLRVTDPQSHVGIVGHRLQTSQPLTDTVGTHGLFLHNKSSLKTALWNSGEMTKTRQAAMATEAQRLNALLHTGRLASAGAQVTAVAVSPCRQWIIRGTSLGQIVATNVNAPLTPVPSKAAPKRRWRNAESETKEPHEYILELHIGPVTAIAVNSQGWVASAGQDCCVHVFPLRPHASSTCLKNGIKFQEHSLPVTAIHLTEAGRLFSVSKDQTCKIFDIYSETLLASISFPSALTCVAVSPLEDAVYCGAANGSVFRAHLWKLAHHQILSTSTSDSASKLRRQPMAVYRPTSDQSGASSVIALDVSSDGSKLAVGYSSGTVIMWNSASCQRLFSIQHSKSPVSRLTFGLKITEDSPMHINASIGKDLDDPQRLVTQLRPSTRCATSFVSTFGSTTSSVLEPAAKSEIESLRHANASLKKLNHDLLLQLSHK